MRDMIDVDGFIAELGDIPVITERALVRQKSRDFFWYSPILKDQLNSKSADLIVCPRDEADVVAVCSLCARRGVPLTARGAGTGNYGQAVPLEGGVVLDMTSMDKVLDLDGGLLTVQPGCRLIDIERAVAADGWELRMYPSTKRTATIGGFVAGGSGGIGSVTYGGLRERGNIVAARVVSCEREPRVVTLTGDAVNQVNHAYGTTGIITALTIPLAPKLPWMDVIGSFDDLMTAVRCARTFGLSDGIAKKLASVVASPLPQNLRNLEVAEGKHVVIAMVARHALTAWRDLLAEFGGTEILCRPTADAELSPELIPAYEYTWNHTTLHALRRDKSVTYLQTLFPPDGTLELIQATHLAYGDEVMIHLEFLRVAGRLTCSGLQVVKFSTAERLWEIIAEMEARGIRVANPHVVTLEDGAGHKRIGAEQPAFKRLMDPAGLLNPGKMRTYVPETGGGEDGRR
jgi:FAD/FMN-containing dehydrogenase